MSVVPSSVEGMTSTAPSGTASAQSSLGLLDPSQQQVWEAVRAETSCAVLGAPGTGKTFTLAAVVAELLNTGAARPEEIIVMGADRRSSARLRDDITSRLTGTSLGTLGRSAQSLAFELVRDDRASHGGAAPRLLTGADEDAALADLLEAEHQAPGTDWADPIRPETLALDGFRAELRNLFAVMAEYDVTADELEELGREHVVWRAAARIKRALDEALAWQSDDEHERWFTTPALLLEAVSVLGARAFGEMPCTGAFATARWLFVDDAHELTESARRLVEAFEHSGVTVVSFGDPDLSVGGFHGARPEHAMSWRAPGAAQPAQIVLEESHRHDAALRQALVALTAHVGVRGSVAHRQVSAATRPALCSRVESWELPPAVGTIESQNAVNEAQNIAAYLRELHLGADVPWSDMAVIVRSSRDIPALERLLARYEIPAASTRPAAAVDDHTVQALVHLARIVNGDDELTIAAVNDLASSPIGGADMSHLRVIRKALRHEDRANGGTRSSDDLIVDAVCALGGLVTLANPMTVFDEAPSMARHHGVVALQRIGACLRAGRAVRNQGGAVDEVLFAIWSAAKLAEPWRKKALGSGTEALRMNRRLDAVVALFDAAKRHVEHEPDADPGEFLAEWNDRNIMADSLVRRLTQEGVTIATPSGVVGCEFPVVVLAGLEEAVWPNLKIRNTLLGASLLEERCRGEQSERSILDRRKDVLHDEVRMLYQALSRASHHVLLSARSSAESAPSRVISWIESDEWKPQLTAGATHLRELTATLRRSSLAALAKGQPIEALRDASAALAHLHAEGVPGADPAAWYGTRDRSSAAPLLEQQCDEDGVLHVRVSPSSVSGFESCPVNWFVERNAGYSPSQAKSIGTIIHAAAEGSFDSLEARRLFVDEQLRDVLEGSEWEQEALVERVHEMLIHLASYEQEARSDGYSVFGVERPFRFDLELNAEAAEATGLDPIVGDAVVTVTGKIDRIEQKRDSGALRVVDFKTGSKAMTKADAEHDPQLATYRLALAHNAVGRRPDDEETGASVSVDSGETIPEYPEVSEARLVYLGTTNKTPASRIQPGGDDGLEEARDRLVIAAHGMAALDLEEAQRMRDDGVSEEDILVYLLSHGAFRFHPDTHCDSHGMSHACNVHRIPEISE